MDPTRFELATSALQGRRSPSWAKGPYKAKFFICLLSIFRRDTYKLVCGATPHPFPRCHCFRVHTSTINYITKLCHYTEFLRCPKRVASSRSKADNQETVLLIHYNQIVISLHYYWRGHVPTGVPPYPLHTPLLGSASLSVSFEQGKVNIYL